MQETARSNPPPAMGVIREDVIHRMGRRCREWDYSARAIYLVTVCLKERGRPVLAEWPEFCASPETAKNNLAVSGEARENLAVSGEARENLAVSGEAQYYCRPTPLGEKVLECWRRIPEFWPQVKLLQCQLMPDHFHGLLFVESPLAVSGEARNARRKTLGDIIRGFKTGCREVGWEDGYVDNILFREGQLVREIEYLRDNPRRLYEKRSNPERFRRVVDLPVVLAVSGEAQNYLTVSAEAQDSAKFVGHFQALGNAALLRRPVLLQVQCSRSDFRYRRERLPGGGWKILRDAAGNPLVEYASPAFEERCADVLRCAGNGAVIVSPCISHGEREIARRANAAGAPLVALRNKGFSRFEKPGGRLFDLCARGNLLLLAPAAWPHVPGEKPPTRESSLVLNRIAQLLCGENAADIDYGGAIFSDIDSAVRTALRPPASNTGDLT